MQKLKKTSMQNIYEARLVGKCQYSLYNDKGEVTQLLIGKDPRDKFDFLYVHDNGIIEACANKRWYAFNPTDLAPIKLRIKGKDRVAFDGLFIYHSGSIEAKHNGKWYTFTPKKVCNMQNLNTRIARCYDWLRNIVSTHSVWLYIILVAAVYSLSVFIGEKFACIFFFCLGFCFVDSITTHHRNRMELKAWRLIATTAEGSPARTYAIAYLRRNGFNVDGVDVAATNSVSETDK